MYEPINFDYLENELNNKDISDSHRWNYLRHKRWMKENRKSDSKES